MAEASPALHLKEPGLWVERTSERRFRTGLPALFLDRDGTVNVDTGYPADPEKIALRPPILPVVRAANHAGLPVVVVTNQSGIARGYFGWEAFAAVNRRILDLLGGQGCTVDLVLACAYHEAGQGALGVKNHPMRKPNPGMILKAAELLEIDLPRSILAGDKTDDMEAARRAGLVKLFLVGDAAENETALRDEIVATIEALTEPAIAVSRSERIA
jgi:D-glycero-D-manno-heptose 1,7-bisphosphate phosphatase